MVVGIAAAARLARVSRWTVARKLKTGTLSSTTDRDRRRQIDTSELLRVFGELHPSDDGAHRSTPGAAHAVHQGAPGAPPELVAALRSQIDALAAELDRTRTEHAQQRAELRRDLDAERDERRRLLGIVEQSQRLLTDQRTTTPATASPNGDRPPRRPRRKAAAPAAAPTLAHLISSWLAPERS